MSIEGDMTVFNPDRSRTVYFSFFLEKNGERTVGCADYNG
jgi:hypothetical protein